MRRVCLSFALLALFCGVLNAEDAPAPPSLDVKSEPVAVSIPDIFTDAVVGTAEVELEKAGESESSEEVPAAVPDKATKVAPAEAATKNFIPGISWPSIQVTQEDRRPDSTPEGVCSRLCERNGRGFLFVSHDECWCRCVVPGCSGGGHGLRSLSPTLRNGNCRDQCRAIDHSNSPDGFYDRDRDRCVCQCSPCAEFDWGHGHSRCK